MHSFSVILTFMYGFVGFLSLLSYFFVYYSEFKSNDVKEKSSVFGWVVWFFCSVVTSLYAILVVKDFLFSCVSIGHLIGTACMIQIFLQKSSIKNDVDE